MSAPAHAIPLPIEESTFIVLSRHKSLVPMPRELPRLELPLEDVTVDEAQHANAIEQAVAELTGVAVAGFVDVSALAVGFVVYACMSVYECI